MTWAPFGAAVELTEQNRRLASDHVSQVTLVVTFMGEFNAMRSLAQRLHARLPVFGAPTRAMSPEEVLSGA